MLTSRDVGSLVIDNLCYHAGGKISPWHVSSLTSPPKEPFLTNILGTLLKQAVGELEGALGNYCKSMKTRGNHWWRGTATFRYYEEAANYLFRKAYIHLHWRPG